MAFKVNMSRSRFDQFDELNHFHDLSAELKIRASVFASKSSGNSTYAVNAPDEEKASKMVEELRIYQAELEVQNEELRFAQQRIEIVRNRYQTLFNQMPLPAMVLNEKGIIEQSNSAADELFGNRKIGKKLSNDLVRNICLKDFGRLLVAIRDAADDEPQIVSHIEIRPQYEKVLVFDFHLIKLPQSYHLDFFVMVLLIDRTAEAAREHDQHFYSMLLNSSQDLVYATDLNGKILVANQAFLKFSGQEAQNVLSQHQDQFFSVRDAVLHRSMNAQVLGKVESLTVDEKIHCTGSTQSIELLTRKFPLRDLQGRVFGVGTISTDVTDIKNQQRQAQLSESVFLSASEAIFITDANTNIVRVNPAFSVLTGFSEESVLGHPASILRADSHEGWFNTAIRSDLMKYGHWAGEITDRTASGRQITFWTTVNVIRDESQKILFFVIVQSDLTHLRELESITHLLATQDSLTGLPNRSLFNDRLNQLLVMAERDNRSFAVLFIDLDHFKEVNDSLGHQVGDELLRKIAQRLKVAVRKEDTVARLGGDEFVVLLTCTGRESAQATAENLLSVLNAPVEIGFVTNYQPMASVGLVTFPHDGRTAEALMAHADTAMYQAKSAGRNRLAVHTQAMSDASARDFAVLNDLAVAIGRQELRLFFQPKVDMLTGNLIGAEALVRWQRPDVGLVAPGHFIAVAERSGLIVKVDQWVARAAISQLALWLKSGNWRPDMRVAINLCARDLHRPELTDELRNLLDEFDVPASCVELEITEGSLLDRSTEIVQRMQEIKQIGLTLAMDDFGTGFSSLSYLRNFPIGVIKIDQSFIRNMMKDEEDKILVETIVAMAQSLKRELVAEGIETDEQRVHLISIGCSVGQGYWFGHPVSATDFARKYFS